MKRLVGIGVASAALALAAAGCGSSGTSTGSGATGTASNATVSVVNTSTGPILANSQGRTLYLFTADTGTTSTCTGACATNWPPLTVSGKPTAGKGVDSSLLGTTQRSDGGTEVTYNGHPLYTYSGDTAAGQATGQNLTAFGAKWYVVGAAGTPMMLPSITVETPGGTPPTTSGNNGY